MDAECIQCTCSSKERSLTIDHLSGGLMMDADSHAKEESEEVGFYLSSSAIRVRRASQVALASPRSMSVLSL